MQSTFFPNKGKSLEQAVAIRVVGNTAPTGGIADGKYVFLKGHSTLPDGGYKANGAIQAGATLTSSNLTATSDGFVNDAYSALSSDLGSPSSASGVTGNDAFSKISTLNSKFEFINASQVAFKSANSVNTFDIRRANPSASNPKLSLDFTDTSIRTYRDVGAGWVEKGYIPYNTSSLLNEKMPYVRLAAGTINNIGEAWDALTIYDRPVCVAWDKSGQYMAILYKYSGGVYGMGLSMFYLYPYITVLSVVGGTKTIKTISPAS